MAEVEIRGVSKRYDDVWAARRVSFSVASGGFTSLLGPSGCGKTTTLRLIAGFVEPDEGEVRIGGRAIDALPPWRRNLGVVFQNYALFPFMTVRENVAFGLRRRRVAGAELDERVAAALDLVGLPNLGRRYPRQLSGGQQQRVALARALVIRPEVLLLDEPLSNLDAKLRAEMRFELKRIQRETGVTSIFVTHDQEEALTLSDQIVVLDRGRVQASAAPRAIWEEPGSAFVADFLGVENLIPARALGADDDGNMRFAIDGTPELVIASSAPTATPGVTPTATPGATPDSPAILGLRASDVTMTRNATAQASNEVVGEVRESTYVGEGILYQVQTPIHPAPLVASSREDFALGENVRLTLPAERIKVLKPDPPEPDA